MFESQFAKQSSNIHQYTKDILKGGGEFSNSI